MSRASTDRAGEYGVADNRERPAQTGDIKRGEARRMSGGEKGLDREWTDVEVRVFLECFRPRNRQRLQLAHPNFGLCLAGKFRQVSDVIIVAVRDENIAEGETLGVQNIQHSLATR